MLIVLLKKTDYNAETDTKLSRLDDKITKNKNKLEDRSIDIILFSLESLMFDGNDGYQFYLKFQPVYKYFKTITNTDYFSSWKSKGLSKENIKPLPTSDNSLTPALSYYNYNIREKFTGSCLEQSKITYTHKKVVNIYIVYELIASSSHFDDPTLKNCLFGAVTLTKNAGMDKYGYSGYGTEFDRRSSFSFPGGGFGRNVLIFGADMSSSTHIDNKSIYILVLGKGPTQVLERTLTAEKVYPINVTVTKKRFCSSLRYNGANYLLMVKKL